MDAVTGGLIGVIGASLVTGMWNYVNNRKAAPELTEQKIKEIQANHLAEQEGKMLNFWLGEVQKVRDQQTQELNGLRTSMDTEKQSLVQHYSEALTLVRQEAQADRTSCDLQINALQGEIRRLIERRGEDQMEFQRKFSDLETQLHEKTLVTEKEKSVFLERSMDRFEKFCQMIQTTPKKDDPI